MKFEVMSPRALWTHGRLSLNGSGDGHYRQSVPMRIGLIGPRGPDFRPDIVEAAQ